MGKIVYANGAELAPFIIEDLADGFREKDPDIGLVCVKNGDELLGELRKGQVLAVVSGVRVAPGQELAEEFDRQAVEEPEAYGPLILLHVSTAYPDVQLFLHTAAAINGRSYGCDMDEVLRRCAYVDAAEVGFCKLPGIILSALAATS